MDSNVSNNPIKTKRKEQDKYVYFAPILFVDA